MKLELDANGRGAYVEASGVSISTASNSIEDAILRFRGSDLEQGLAIGLQYGGSV